AECGEKRRLVAHREIARLARLDPVRATQLRVDLGDRRVHCFLTRRLHEDAAYALVAEEAELGGRERDVDRLVGVHPALLALLGEDADDLERDATDADRAPEQGLRRDVQPFPHTRAQHRNAAPATLLA